MTKALVVLSGGQDSTTCLFWAKKEFEEVHAITFDYGQRHRTEIAAAMRVAALAGIASHRVVAVGVPLLGTSPLTDPRQPLAQYKDAEDMAKVIGGRVEATFVPMRNALFLTLAANTAAAQGYTAIVAGMCQEDNANYPDCTELFIEKFELMMNQALGSGDQNWISVYTPLMRLTKAKSVQFAVDVGAYWALAWSHTAYDGQYPPVGRDHATLLRAQGFEQASLPDPLVVRAWREGKMGLPATPNYEVVRQNLEHYGKDIPGDPLDNEPGYMRSKALPT